MEELRYNNLNWTNFHVIQTIMRLFLFPYILHLNCGRARARVLFFLTLPKRQHTRCGKE
jgi:hypothetical protein